MNKIKALILLTHKCLGTCSYCYQMGDFRKSTIDMSIETLDKSIDFLRSLYGISNVKFELFGGDPLLNRKTFEHAIRQYVDIGFLATTPGTCVIGDKEYLDFINGSNNLQLKISLSALKYKYGQSLYVEKFIHLFRKILKKCSINFLIDDPDEPDLMLKISDILSCGAKYVEFNLVREVDIISDKKDLFLSIIKKIFDYTISNTNRSKCNIDSILDRDYSIGSSCGAGSEKIAIDCNGDIFPCDYFVQFKEFCIGNIDNGIVGSVASLSSPRNCVKQIQNSCLAHNYKLNGDTSKETKISKIHNGILLDSLEYLAKKYKRGC
jgi:uncharacterized protein